MQCTEYVADKATKRLLPDEVNVGKRISDHCEKNGVIVRPLAHLNILSPPLVMTRGEVDLLVDGLAAGIKATADDLVREGVRLS
jgi:adenosylmethionine-8-amino-7-oxononanoate aminotransferase